MSYTASKVIENFTSYTFSEKGLYVFTGSVDGGYNVTLGGTCTQLYHKHSYAGTVAVLWAENAASVPAAPLWQIHGMKLTEYARNSCI